MSRIETIHLAADLLRKSFPILYCPIHQEKMVWNKKLDNWYVTEDDFTAKCPIGCVFSVDGVIRDRLLSLRQLSDEEIKEED